MVELYSHGPDGIYANAHIHVLLNL